MSDESGDPAYIKVGTNDWRAESVRRRAWPAAWLRLAQ